MPHTLRPSDVRSHHPLIGVTAGRKILETGVGELNHFVQPVFYAEAILAAGGTPILMPAVEDTLEGAISRMDGLILTGGGDVDPACYGQDAHPLTVKVDAVRDAFELDLARVALSSSLPVLGICRGAQVMNVAAGGSLLQDIPSAHGDGIAHMQPSLGNPSHLVAVDRESRLARIVGASTLEVNSGHHQSVAALGAELRPVAWAGDGIVEAIEADRHPWAIGVQWHPEMLWREHLPHRRLFEALIEAAGRRMNAGAE